MAATVNNLVPLRFTQLYHHGRSVISRKNSMCVLYNTSINKRQYCIHYARMKLSKIGLSGILTTHKSSMHHTSTVLPTACHYSTQQPKEITPDIYTIIGAELSSLPSLMQKEIKTMLPELRAISQYYLDGQGKSFRPMAIMLMAMACNHHKQNAHSELHADQRQVALIAEMIHTASLVHDDVIDQSDTRRGKPSADAMWGQRKSILAGDYILSIAGVTLARINNTDVVTIITQIIDDLVRGEFMQLSSNGNETIRFTHYLRKTFRKTASMLANGCKAVALLGNCPPDITDVAYEYGRNLGLAFQLIDDVLDFVSTETTLGKPTAADLRLGLATAPVLFAAQQYPELNSLILRRFSEEGDVDTAHALVTKSDGVAQTRFMAEKYSEEAARQISSLSDSPSRTALLDLTRTVLNRDK